MKNSSVLKTSLIYGGAVALAIAIIGAIVGLVLDGVDGVISALLGAALAAVFMGLTAASMLFASRLTRNDPSSPAYFGIIVGVWFIKLVLFVVVAIVLRGQAWLSPYVFFGAVIAAVIGSLIADMIAMQRSRVPYVGDIELPGGQ